MIEVEKVDVSEDKKRWNYFVNYNGVDFSFGSERVLTLDEIKDMVGGNDLEQTKTL